MKCPYCDSLEDKVIDSRIIKDGAAVRRRRQCLSCNARFTSYETVEEIQLRVVKKDGRRENFDRNKIRVGIQKACEKRPIPTDAIDDIVDRIEEKLTRGKKEVETREIGETVIIELSNLDEVAYVRFASVYREFKDVNEFMDELKRLLINTDKAPPQPQEKNSKS
ncbi:MAG TPA: transcriptional regulator NrdR [bacterium]|nr:transcriptional regulator NrdR [bacterium]